MAAQSLLKIEKSLFMRKNNYPIIAVSMLFLLPGAVSLAGGGTPAPTASPAPGLPWTGAGYETCDMDCLYQKGSETLSYMGRYIEMNIADVRAIDTTTPAGEQEVLAALP